MSADPVQRSAAPTDSRIGQTARARVGAALRLSTPVSARRGGWDSGWRCDKSAVTRCAKGCLRPGRRRQGSARQGRLGLGLEGALALSPLDALRVRRHQAALPPPCPGRLAPRCKARTGLVADSCEVRGGRRRQCASRHRPPRPGLASRRPQPRAVAPRLRGPARLSAAQQPASTATCKATAQHRLPHRTPSGLAGRRGCPGRPAARPSPAPCTG